MKPGMLYRHAVKLWLIMRLTTVILVATMMQVSAAGFAQKISLSKSNANLKNIFRAIKTQSGYNFLYTDNLLQHTKPININVKNEELSVVLEKIFSGQSLDYSIDQTTIVVYRRKNSFLENITDYFNQMRIRGRVINEAGDPLIGATIQVKGGKGVIANSKGEFDLGNQSAGTVLVFTFVGYKPKELTVTNGDFLAVSLEPEPASLDQVMVTGYQIISKERATGSFSQVNRVALEHRPVSNLSTALQGMVAGMQAKENEDGSVDFLIRGNTSLYGNNRPLIVVDGFPVTGTNFADINPNDIESVTVLKDAAAASIWGARAANGVIVLVSKKAKYTDKLHIDASVFTRISNRANFDQISTQANSADQVAYERKAFDNNWFLNQYTGSFTDVLTSLTLAQEALYANKAGTLATADMNAELDRLSKISNRSQIQDLLMQNAITNQYNVSLQTGSARSRSYGSLMYENNKGGFVKNGYDRFNLNFNNDYKISKSLNFMVGLNLQYKNQETSGATLSEIQQLSPYELLLNPDGSYGTNLNTYNRAQLALIPYKSFPYSDWSYNLLQEVQGRKLTNQNLSARFQTGLNLKITEGLSFDSKFQYERARTDAEIYYDESTFYVRSQVNSMTEYNSTTKVIGRSVIPKGGILRPSKNDQESYLVRNQLNFDKMIGEKHRISVIAGMEISSNTTTGRTSPYLYGYYPDRLQSTVPTYGYGSSVDQFTSFDGISGVQIPGGNTVLTWRRNKFVSFYGNGSYTYNNRYTVSGSVRSDASNFITDNPDLRWSPLWSVGAKWNLKAENFMDKLTVLDRLDLRLTYGKNGNVETSTSTSALLSVGTSLNATTGTITGTVSDYGNPGLRWEKTTSTNLGLDFSLFGNALFGSVDLYNKKGEGIIGNIALPAVTGTTLQRFNNAQISNRGIELSLGTSVLIPNTAIRYSSTLTYAYNRNKITSLYNPTLYTYQLLQGEFVEGRPVNSVYSFTYAGMVNGVPQVYGPNGALSTFNDLTIVSRGLGLPYLNYEGTAIPPHTLGWVSNIQVKDFNLVATFIGKMGGVYRNPVFNYSTLIGSGKTSVDRFVNDVLAGNPDLPGFALPSENNLYRWSSYAPYLSSLVESSSYIECKELTLEYNLPGRLAEAINSSNVKVFAQSRDLGLIWRANSKGYNPDWLPGTNRPVQTFTFGVNVKF